MPESTPSFAYTTRATALARHKELSAALADLCGELYSTLTDERTTEVTTWQQNPVGTGAKLDKLAKVNTLPHVREVWRIRGEIEATQHELEDIRIQLAYGGVA